MGFGVVELYEWVKNCIGYGFMRSIYVGDPLEKTFSDNKYLY